MPAACWQGKGPASRAGTSCRTRRRIVRRGPERRPWVALYVAAGLGALAAIGLAVSTFTEHAIAAISAILVITIGSEVADNVPQFSVVHPFLPTHWWLSFDGLLRSPVAWGEIGQGLLSFGIYAVIFAAIAWARFSTADVTS